MATAKILAVVGSKVIIKKSIIRHCARQLLFKYYLKDEFIVMDPQIYQNLAILIVLCRKHPLYFMSTFGLLLFYSGVLF